MMDGSRHRAAALGMTFQVIGRSRLGHFGGRAAAGERRDSGTSDGGDGFSDRPATLPLTLSVILKEIPGRTDTGETLVRT